MPGLNGTGPRGQGPMTGGGRGLCHPAGAGSGSRGAGFGFRGASPAWPYVGRGRGGAPRCRAPGFRGGAMPAPAMGRDMEIDLLKSQAQAIKEQLGQVEDRIRQLEGNA